MKSFIEQLVKALEDYLDPYLDEEVYIDYKRLQPGYEYNEALASAICQSICMIVVYTPKYARHSYCLQEYAAMKEIEKERMELLAERADPGLRLIIPIILKGEIKELPSQIRECRHWCDFSKFTLANTNISSNPEFIEKIEKIAKCINKHYEAFHEVNVFNECNKFKLPSKEKIQPWREEPKMPLPFRTLAIPSS